MKKILITAWIAFMIGMGSVVSMADDDAQKPLPYGTLLQLEKEGGKHVQAMLLPSDAPKHSQWHPTRPELILADQRIRQCLAKREQSGPEILRKQAREWLANYTQYLRYYKAFGDPDEKMLVAHFVAGGKDTSHPFTVTYSLTNHRCG